MDDIKEKTRTNRNNSARIENQRGELSNALRIQSAQQQWPISLNAAMKVGGDFSSWRRNGRYCTSRQHYRDRDRDREKEEEMQTSIELIDE